MKVDTMLGTLDGAGAAAARAEALGYDGVWSSEVAHNPFLPLVLAAEHAPTVDLGTSIAVALARTPMVTAAVAWDLQAYSGGRLVVGLGSQVKPHIERRFSMPWSHPAPRMREYILAMRAIWATWQDGVRLDFQGDFYTHTLMTPYFDPGPLPSGPPKVFLAAVGDHMAEVAGEVADGMLVHGFCTTTYLRERVLPAIERGLERSGRSRADFQISYPLFVATGRDDHEVASSAERVRQQIAFYASTPAYRPVLEVHGWGDLQPELTAMSKKGQWVEMATLVDDRVLDAFAVVADVDHIGAAVRDRIGGLVDRTGFSPPEGLGDDELAGVLSDLKS